MTARSARATLAALTTAVAAAAALLGAPTAAHADADDGVVCPAGTQAERQGDVLRCKVTLHYVRLSACPPAGFENYTAIQVTGRDSCLPQVVALKNQASVPSAMAPLPLPPRMPDGSALPAALGFLAALAGPPTSDYSRELNPTGSDRWLATKEFSVWPDRLPLQSQLGRDAARGVTCPSGFDGVSIANGRGLRCEDRQSKLARCDAGWTLKVDLGPNNKDICQTGVGIGTLTGNYTIPEGTGAAGHPSNHGWTLTVRDETDLWTRTKYSVPVSR